MRLKKWLIFSYLLVMLIPLILGYLLFNWVQNYDKNREVADYLESIPKIVEYENKLNDPLLYKGNINKYDFLKEEDKELMGINLYNKYGMILYSSLGKGYIYDLNTKELYSDLFNLRKGYKTFSLKKPVFEKNELVGFYEIITVRNNMVKDINKVSVYVFILFLILIIIIFVIVIFLVNKKLNHPLNLLMQEMTNFSEGKKGNKLKHKAHDEMGELIVHFENMKEKLEIAKDEIEKQQKSKEYLIRAISHDLKTPLTSIRAYSESLDKVDSKERGEYIKVILNKCDFMQRMLKDLLDYNLLTSEAKMDFVLVEGQEFFEMLLSGYEELGEEKNIELETYIRVKGKFQLDVNELVRVMDNLIGNAYLYTPHNKKISIGACSKEYSLPTWMNDELRYMLNPLREKGVIVWVKNEGSLISESEWENIFEPLYMLDKARCKKYFKSTGLGLSIAKNIINKHAAEIKVVSKEQYGTVFFFYLNRID